MKPEKHTRVVLPSKFDESTMHPFFDQVLDNSLAPRSKLFAFDFTDLEFITPPGVTALANITRYLLNNGCWVIYTYTFTQYSKAFMFLRKAGYFNTFMNDNSSFIIDEAQIPKHYFPIAIRRKDDYLPWMHAEVRTWFDTQLGYDTDKYHKELFTCFSEIFINLEHASRDNKCACVFMQHYPAKGDIEIAISDFGIGIPTNIRQIFSGKDSECICYALEEGVSTKTSPRNRGSGLSSLINIVCSVLSGCVSIYSLKGSVQITKDMVKKSKEHKYIYPGTLVLIKINTSYLEEKMYTYVEEDQLEW